MAKKLTIRKINPQPIELNDSDALDAESVYTDTCYRTHRLIEGSSVTGSVSLYFNQTDERLNKLMARCMFHCGFRNQMWRSSGKYANCVVRLIRLMSDIAPHVYMQEENQSGSRERHSLVIDSRYEGTAEYLDARDRFLVSHGLEADSCRDGLTRPWSSIIANHDDNCLDEDATVDDGDDDGPEYDYDPFREDDINGH